ncbi:MAG: hypothetical protein ACT4TC_21770 [Myxococcaceae bacterium]
MKKILIGLVAAMATTAFAGGNKSLDKSTTLHPDSTSTQSTSSATGGSGTAGASDLNTSGATTPSLGDKSGMTSSNEISGKVVKHMGKTVYVEHMGAVVAIKVDSKTRFEGDAIKSSKDIKAGQDIRASFTVENTTDNVATSIGLAGTGGSGFSSESVGSSGSDVTVPSLPSSDMGRSSLPAEPERIPSSPLPEEPGTKPSNPTY